MGEPGAIDRRDTDVDVIVIGAGVNGTGVARDCALRGLRVCLLERNDLAFGASGNSSGMIHGGVRYLLSNPGVTRLSCLDSGYIQRIAPHLLFRIPFLMPIDRGIGSRAFLVLADAFFAAYDRYQPLKRGKPHARLTPQETRVLEPGIEADLVGAIAFDEWGIDGARLCAASALDAHEHGAQVRTHVTADEILRDDAGRVTGVRWRDRLTGAVGKTTSKLVVNATGAWAPVTAGMGGLPSRSAAVRPTKGIHIVFDRRLSNHAVAVQSIDNRQVFTEPWQNVSVLGTTDTDYYGDLDRCFATTDEVRYLIQAVARVMPSIRKARIIGTFAGVRPTLHSYGPIPDALSREHDIVDHSRDGCPGLYSMIGGKLASYRIFAQELTDRIAPLLGCERACETHTKPLPGGDEAIDALELGRRCGIEAVAARRLVYRHGSRAKMVAEGMRANPSQRQMVCACESVSEAEVRHVIRTEFALTVGDVARRTRLGLGPCGGMRCVLRCGMILADERGASPRDGLLDAFSFLRETWQRRVVGLGAVQARQEALAMAALRAQLGIRAPEEQGE